MQQAHSHSIHLDVKDGKLKRAWDLHVTSEDKDPIDINAYARAVIQVAIADIINELEQDLLALKGKRGTKYTTQRHKLKEKIAQLHALQELKLDDSVRYTPDR